MIETFLFTISAHVPVICRITVDELFCNSSYSLYIESSEGTRLAETGGPTIKRLAILPEGERYVLNAVQF